MRSPSTDHVSAVMAFTIAAMTAVAGNGWGQPDPFNALLHPLVSQVEVGETALVTFEVDSTAMQFNAYDITIQFDPAIVRFLSVDEGSLMLGGCGSTICFLSETDSTVRYEHSILCAGVTLDGPGVLSTFSFEAIADGTSRLDIISHPDSSFADAGFFINPQHHTYPRQVSLRDAWILVGAAAGCQAQRPASISILEQNTPNPFNPSTLIRFVLDQAGPARMAVFEPGGRLVWEKTWHFLPAGPHRLHWEARAHDGATLASGAYLYRLRTPTGSQTRKLVLLR